ncbi:cyclic nucleotide-binding domain-containing protein [Devosia sp.]|uniref:cyclic nucleotide-binding domain-containing protein n=1 Tax=Devosia sp. TaxID=1871048 RepID=UPI0025C262FF|nr:cyclic nucleotide-binding domain-containing protein [Devosia sp.]
MFNVQQGKRLFGIVGTGEWLAMVLMGFLMPVVVPLVGLPNLLWLAAVGMSLALLVMNINMRRHGHLLTETAAPAPASPERTVGMPKTLGILRNRYAIALFALSMAWWIGFFFIDNIFYHEASRQLPTSEQLAGFLGLYLGVVGILALLSNLFAAGPIVSRFGLKWSLLTLPVGLAVGAAVMALTGALSGPALLLFCAAVATKIWSVGAGFSVDQAARSVLFQPFSAALRTRVQTLVDGVAQPLSTGAAGVLLLLIGLLFPHTSLPLVYGLLVVVAAHLLIVVLVNRGYGRALIDALGTRRLTGTELIVNDATSRAILLDGLHSPQAGAVIYAMRLLASVDPGALSAELPRLLERAEPDVRRYALAHIAELDLRDALPAVRAAIAKETDPDVIGVGLRTLARFGDLSPALGHLDGADAARRASALVALLESGDDVAIAAADTALATLGGSPAEADRMRTATILAEADSALAPSLLPTLLADPALPVRRAALRATGRRGLAVLWPAVIEALQQRPTRNAALSALVAGGAAALPAIGDALRSGAVPPAEMACLARACGRMRAPAAIPMLLPHVDSPDASLRGAALRALQQCGYRPAPAEMSRLHDCMRNESRLASWLSAAAADLETCDEAGLLQAALAEQLLRCRDRMLTLVALSGNAAAIERAADNLTSRDPRQRAYALEVIDIEAPAALKPLVLPVLEDLAPGERLRRLNGHYPQARTDCRSRLVELAGDSARRVDAWTQASAIHALSLIDPEATAGLRGELSTASQLVRETLRAPRKTIDINQGDRRVLSTIEKTIILRSAGIFAQTTDEVLADVATIATVVEAAPGEAILVKGDAGESMYVISSGRVRVHDGAHEVAQLGPGDVFGEMALIEPEPRSASVTALEETCLLQLDQQAFFELVDDRPEVARGLLRVLSRRLREAI